MIIIKKQGVIGWRKESKESYKEQAVRQQRNSSVRFFFFPASQPTIK